MEAKKFTKHKPISDLLKYFFPGRDKMYCLMCRANQSRCDMSSEFIHDEGCEGAESGFVTPWEDYYHILHHFTMLEEIDKL